MKIRHGVVPVRIDPEVEYIDWRCRYHCVKCGRHFGDLQAFKMHFDFPGRFEGCRKPDDNDKYTIFVVTDGECKIWADYSYQKDWPPKMDCRVYGSERIK